MTPEEIEIHTLDLMLTDDPETAKLIYSMVGKSIDVIIEEIGPLIGPDTTGEDVLFAFEFIAERFRDIGAL